MRRGADAFLVKPLGSEVVRHIWQFVKKTPEGSFKQDRDESVSSSFGLRSGGSPSTTTAVDESGLQKSVLQMVQLTDEVAQIEISYAADTDYQQQGGPTETDVDPSAARVRRDSPAPAPTPDASPATRRRCKRRSHATPHYHAELRALA